MRSAQDVADILELTELTSRYAYAMDGREWEVLRTLFTDDVELDYGLGEENIMRGADLFVSSCEATLTQMDATHHIFANHLFQVDGDRAKGRYYMHAQHLKHGVPGGALHTLGGLYEDEFVRTADGWKISKRAYRAIWGRGNNAFNPGFRSDEPSA